MKGYSMKEVFSPSSDEHWKYERTVLYPMLVEIKSQLRTWVSNATDHRSYRDLFPEIPLSANMSEAWATASRYEWILFSELLKSSLKLCQKNKHYTSIVGRPYAGVSRSISRLRRVIILLEVLSSSVGWSTMPRGNWGETNWGSKYLEFSDYNDLV